MQKDGKDIVLEFPENVREVVVPEYKNNTELIFTKCGYKDTLGREVFGFAYSKEVLSYLKRKEWSLLLRATTKL